MTLQWIIAYSIIYFIISFSGFKIMLLYFNHNLTYMYLIFTIRLFVYVHACAEMCYYRYLLYTIKKNSFQSLMSSQCAAMALQSCGWIPSCTLSNFPAFQAVCAMLTSLMVHHTETVLKVIPTFISCVNHILLQFKAYLWPQKCGYIEILLICFQMCLDTCISCCDLDF